MQQSYHNVLISSLRLCATSKKFLSQSFFFILFFFVDRFISRHYHYIDTENTRAIFFIVKIFFYAYTHLCYDDTMKRWENSCCNVCKLFIVHTVCLYYRLLVTIFSLIFISSWQQQFFSFRFSFNRFHFLRIFHFKLLSMFEKCSLKEQ